VNLKLHVLKGQRPHLDSQVTLLIRGAQTLGIRAPGRLHFVWQHLIFMGPQWKLPHITFLAS